MPPRSMTKPKTTETAAAPAAVPVQETVAAPAAVPDTTAAQEKRRGGPRKAAATPVAAQPEVQATAPPAPVAADADQQVAAGDDSAAKERVAPTPESVHTDFAELVTILDQQITQLRDSSDKTGSVKFLRAILRRVKTLQSNSARVMKRRQPTKRANNNSGFLKPVVISPEIAKFTGLNPDALHSRVDVTKFLCKYIRDKDLQKEGDKRQINPDPALSKLLGYDTKKAEQPLTYFHMQSLLKSHFRSGEEKK